MTGTDGGGLNRGRLGRAQPPAALLFWCLAGVLLFVFGGCDWYAGEEKPRVPVPDEKVVNFAKLYGLHCAGCHGEHGELGPAPPLNDPTFLAIIDEAQLERVIADGRKGTLMPAWSREKGGPLSDKQIAVLTKGIHKGEHWKVQPISAADIPPYSAPSDQAKPSADAGRKVFAMACAGCHGEQGEGKSGKETRKIGAVRDPAFLALLSDQALRRLVITGRKDLGMPGYGPAARRPDSFKPLTSEDVSNVVELLKQWRSADASTPGEHPLSAKK
jgi:cytochrome c oxidase cbb3-type subunit 3/ubiquinol-cytochrome c reductase cytochrome c subunit